MKDWMNPRRWRVHRWFRPIHYRSWEMVLMRVLLALVVLLAYPNANRVWAAKAGKEVGLARVVSLDWLADPVVLEVGRWVLMGALVLYVFGRLYAIALTLMAFLIIAPATLANSQGADLHHMQVLGLVLLGQWGWYVYSAVRGGEFLKVGRRTQILGVFYSQQVVVAAYLTTAVWKLYHSKFGWIREAKDFPVQLVKTREAEYYNKLQEAGQTVSGGLMGKVDSWFSVMGPRFEEFLITYPNVCRAVIGSGLLLELFAFLMLIDRRSRAFYGGLLVIFHLVIGRVMSLDFDFNIYLLLILFVNVPWLVVVIWRRVGGVLRARA